MVRPIHVISHPTHLRSQEKLYMQLKSPMNLILGMKKAHYCALMHASLPNSRAAVPRKMPSRERTCLKQNNENMQPDIYLRS
jgi:hypothetical protein